MDGRKAEPAAVGVLAEIDDEAPDEIGTDEAAEEVALHRRARSPTRQDDDERDHEEGLEERHRQAADTVAEVEGERQGRGVAEGVVAGAGQEAADPADGDCRRERDGQQVTRAALDPALLCFTLLALFTQLRKRIISK